MRDFLTSFPSALFLGQQQRLRQFLIDHQSGRAAADPARLQQQLAAVGGLLPLPAVDPTDPVGYNSLLQTLLANLAGLYQETDRLESVQQGTNELNQAELDRIEVATRDLGTVLARAQAANAANAQWTDVFFETFGADSQRETGRDWYTPRGTARTSGFISSFLPLHVDPEDRSLTLLPGGDFSRSVSAAGERIVHGEVEEILGLSIDPNHPVSQAIDGRSSSYWRELILSDGPIQADPLQVPWLPTTYQAGAACRLHFTFPFAIPFTEVFLRPFARFPAQVLQVAWDNRKQPVANLVTNGAFTAGGTNWTSGAVAGTGISFPAGYQGRFGCQITAVSGRATMTNASGSLATNDFAYHLVLKANRDPAIKLLFLVQWFDAVGNLQRADWHEPRFLPQQWVEVDKLFVAPSGTVAGNSVQLSIVADGSGNVQFTDVSFSRTTGAYNTNLQAELEGDAMRVPLDNAAGTDLWLVVSQPHYEFLHMAIPAGELDSQDLWQQVRIQAEAQAETVFNTNPDTWRLSAGTLDTTVPRTIQGNAGILVKEAARLGGRIKDMALQLLKFAQPDTATVAFNRHMYVIGAWEVDIRHREYAAQGLYVTTPFTPRGEVRELQLLTTPPLSQLPGRVKFWLTARATDKVDKARPFFGRATFGSSTENPGRRADTHFALTPVTKREEFPGTDRQNRVALQYHPYVDRDRVWTLQTALTSGGLTAPLLYDPNKDQNYLSVPDGTIRQVPGYRPLRVTLQFSDGTVARPDLMGAVQRGDIGFSGPELLTPATLSQQIQFLSGDQQKDIENQLLHADPAKREQLRQQLVQQGLLKGTGLLRPPSPTQASRTQTVTLQALQTRFTHITTGLKGVALSLYWHKSVDDTRANATITSGDVLISPAKYTVDADRGVIILRDGPPNGDKRYDTLVAYYYFNRSEGSRLPGDSRSTASLPTTGVDFQGILSQALPVTRNVTDYVRGQVANLRPALLDDLSPDYYPVYEYLVDEHGRVLFGNNFAAFGDTPAKVIVEYESLLIEPRLIIEYAPGALNEFSTKTPVLHDFTLLMNSRK